MNFWKVVWHYITHLGIPPHRIEHVIIPDTIKLKRKTWVVYYCNCGYYKPKRVYVQK